MQSLELRQILDALKSERRNIEAVWDIITQFVVPFRDDFYKYNFSENAMDWRTRGKFDDTAVIANSNLAANLHSALTNNIVRWFDLVFRNERFNAETILKIWIEECVRRIWRALQETNFDLEANEAYLDLTAYGQGIVCHEVEENPDGSLNEMVFSTIPLDSCWYEIDTRGRLLKLFRKYSWTPSQLVDKFGMEALPEHIREKALSPEGVTTHEEVIYCIYKRKNHTEATPYEIQPPHLRAYGAKYFLYDSGERIGEEQGYYEMPAYLLQWRRSSGSKFGYSQAMICLDDILTLNEFVQLVLGAGEKAVDPAIITTLKGVFGDIDIQAGGVTVVQSLDSIKEFESKARFDVSSLTKKELQESINRCFFMDQLQLKESPAMTATEVNVRYQLMQRLLGPTLGRLQANFLDPLIKRTFMIMYRYRLLPPIPEQLAGNMSEVDIEYLGSMARSQRLDEVQATERWIGNVGAMAQMFPNALDRVNSDEVVVMLGQAMGVPARAMRSNNEVQQQRKAKEKLQEQQMQLATLQQTGDALTSMGEGVEKLGASAEGGNLPDLTAIAGGAG
jgi:hypothetical protein